MDSSIHDDLKDIEQLGTTIERLLLSGIRMANVSPRQRRVVRLVMGSMALCGEVLRFAFPEPS